MGLSAEIDRITNMILIGGAAMFILALAGGLLFYVGFKRKRRVKMEDIQTDYSMLKRMDSADYLKFDDIRDNMIIAERGTRFIAVISCRGFEFFSAHVTDRINAQNGYRGFIGTIVSPITYRIYSKSIDMEYTLQRYLDAQKQIEEKLFNLNEDYQELKKTLEQTDQEGQEAFRESGDALCLLEELERMKKQLESLNWRKFHIEDQIAYGRAISGNDVNPEQMETYVFDWTYRPMEYPVDLSEEEIYKEAKKKLNIMERSYIHALSMAGVKAHRCSTAEIIRMCRKHMRPLSAERYNIEEDFQKDAFFKEIISTDQKDALEQELASELAFGMEQAVFQAAVAVREDIVAGAMLPNGRERANEKREADFNEKIRAE